MAIHIQQREFMAVLSAATWTLAARTQQSGNRIWFLVNDPTIKGENHEHS